MLTCRILTLRSVDSGWVRSQISWGGTQEPRIRPVSRGQFPEFLGQRALVITKVFSDDLLA